jgi:hypothetical protein
VLISTLSVSVIHGASPATVRNAEELRQRGFQFALAGADCNLYTEDR